MVLPAAVAVRPATVDDIRAIAEFQTQAWNEAYKSIVPAEYLARMTVATREVRWGDRIRNGDRTMLLAERAGAVVALVSFGLRADERSGPRLELMSLYVAASERGAGLGSELLELAVGRRSAVLWVFEANKRAIEFYRRHAFVPDGEGTRDVDTGLPEIRLSR